LPPHGGTRRGCDLNGHSEPSDHLLCGHGWGLLRILDRRDEHPDHTHSDASGLPPHTAIGTDRFGIIGIGIAGWYEFHRQRLINYRIGLIVAVPVLFGTILGSNLVLQIKENVLRDVILAINVILIIFVLLNPKIGVEARVSVTRRHEVAIALLVSFLVGVYGGFYGPWQGHSPFTFSCSGLARLSSREQPPRRSHPFS